MPRGLAERHSGCPANFVPLGVSKEACMREAWNGTRGEAFGGADREFAAPGFEEQASTAHPGTLPRLPIPTRSVLTKLRWMSALACWRQSSFRAIQMTEQGVDHWQLRRFLSRYGLSYFPQCVTL